MLKPPIYVTRPSLPPIEEFIPYLQNIWTSGQITNSGPYHQQLERELCSYLGVDNISLFANGTIALITALQSLQITGEVITTPFSFVATSHALRWNGIKPIFVDIDPSTFNLDPSKIEAAITSDTTAIMPVHCYGQSCDVEAIEKIAKKYKLKVIYDAAHAFGVKFHSESLLKHGDLSVVSFHATKVFNTFEGGAIICPNEETKKSIDQLKNFGFVDEITVVTAGINGKMSEFNCALGILQLKYVDGEILKRKIIDSLYRETLASIRGIEVPKISPDDTSNHSYFPVLVKSTYPLKRDELFHRLREHEIYARRYFFPLISEFPMYSGLASSNANNLPVATQVSHEILCLPIYPSLDLVDVKRIINILENP
jgi:dTDP-4-amino-4,6-dideoxygalactose transaminase